MSICLCMIVKNEAHIIETTLENVCDKVPLAYWVISDTGSTDDTKERIRRFFEAKNIPGELVEHEWRDFAYNRTKALECAFQKTDMLMLMDADDSIVGKIPFPKWVKDKYNVTFGSDFSYKRPMFITNRKKWKFTGVLHEFLEAQTELQRTELQRTEPQRTEGSIEGDYHIVSGRGGARSKNENKYADDAEVLEKAFATELRQDLRTRYAFYCAQSWKDAKNVSAAVEWYRRCIDLNGWNQEKYYACMQLGELLEKTDFEKAQSYWTKSIEYDPERIEGIVLLAAHLYNQKNHVLVNALYHKFKDYDPRPKDKLFVRFDLYDLDLEYYNSISAFYACDKASGYDCCKKIILKCKREERVAQTIRNLEFYKEFLGKDRALINILKQRGKLV